MTSTLLGASLAAYIIASILYLVNLHVKRKYFAAYGTAAAAVGFALQSVRLVMQAAAGELPFANAPEAMFFLSWTITAIYLLTFIRFRIPALGALAMPLSLIALTLVYRFPASTGQPFAGDVWLRAHIVAIIASFALFAQAFCCAVFYLVQNKLLKSKKFKGMFRRLPPLETIDALGFHLVVIAFPMLTIGIAAGIAGVKFTGIQEAHNANVKLMASGLTWVVYALYLIAHSSAGWRGKRANSVLIIGAGLIALTTALHSFV
ncbi:MAG: cytochrome c biogenesis protein CcsA [Armatimonadota bacterium]